MDTDYMDGLRVFTFDKAGLFYSWKWWIINLHYHNFLL